MSRHRVVVLCHEDLIPPDSIEGLSASEVDAFRTEYDVTRALRELGHEVQVVGVSDDLAPIRSVALGFDPHVVFNLLMEFRDVGNYQAHVTSYLELLGVSFTGCHARGILLTRDKALCKKILRYHRVPTPRFAVFERGAPMRRAAQRDLSFPLIVKSVDEEASLGIAQASVVSDLEKLKERVEFVHRSVGTDAIAEEYIEGRELTQSILGNERLQAFPPWELFFDKLPEGSLPIATARAKFDRKYQARVGIDSGPAREMPPATATRIAQLCKRVYRVLGLSGYARLDLRLSPDGQVYVIEVNSTPDVAEGEDFADSAKAVGLSYPQLIQRIVALGIAHGRRRD
ncbi:MAG TPA: ATP-grasp domain-containing protein [Myxococcota bacterium]|jgi:D-alanine-D-alanine ligase|nr:ATP-grasp domain-containing protein [Myxococcota bacterium]